MSLLVSNAEFDPLSLWNSQLHYSFYLFHVVVEVFSVFAYLFGLKLQRSFHFFLLDVCFYQLSTCVDKSVDKGGVYSTSFYLWHIGF